MRPLKILVVDDDAEAAGELAVALERHRCSALVVPDAYVALERIATTTFDAVVTEVALPGASGIELLLRLRGEMPAVVHSWLATPAIVARAQAVGARAVLAKPSDPGRLLAAVRSAVQEADPARAGRRLALA